MEAWARGWDVLGLEVAPSCVEAMRARGIPAECVVLTDYAGPGESFDVVAMYSVIEHVHDPAAYLLQAFRLLKSGGLLILRLPDTPDEGPPASLIAHLYHFNRTTISELLRRHHFEVLRFGNFSIWKPKRYPGELPNMNVISRKA
jgi:2-polyprenyl-3-methyl-5-hydroxy-6-metoxy-1,4-benzoquinol methylase